MLPIIIAARVGIKSRRIAILTQLDLGLHEQIQMVANAACIVSSQQFSKLASYLFLVIRTYFIFKLLIFFRSILFTFYCTIGPHLSALKLETNHLYKSLVAVKYVQSTRHLKGIRIQIGPFIGFLNYLATY